VPYWDLAFGAEANQPRDSSAAAIAVCGLRELAGQLRSVQSADRYRLRADAILTSLVANYAAAGSDDEALLWHGVYDMPKAVGVDEANLWGDYFYVEALTRATQPLRQLYW
jgi:unsaturated chondroitin disaccharide hydrolase